MVEFNIKMTLLPQKVRLSVHLKLNKKFEGVLEASFDSKKLIFCKLCNKMLRLHPLTIVIFQTHKCNVQK